MASGTDRTAIEAEQAVAGSLLIDDNCFEAVSRIVREADFCVDLYKAIFSASSALHAEGKPADPVTIKAWASRHGVEIDNSSIAQLMEVTPTAANVEAYARIVRDASKRRALRGLMQEILDDETTPTESLLADASVKLEGIISEADSGRLISSAEMVRRFYDDLNSRESGKRNVVPSGYRSLDKQLGGGFIRGGLYILAARPAMGKTTVALNIADRIRGGVLFVSLEMPPEQLTAKRIARETGIPSNALTMGEHFTDEEYQKIFFASVKLEQSGLVINSKSGATVPEVAVMARGVKNLSAVIVDYIGLLRPERKNASRYEGVTEITGALKQLAISLNVPIIALSQLNRSNEGREDKHPRLSDLRDSGSVEQDADGVILLHRPDYYRKEQGERERWEPSIIECDIAKNRHAGTGTVELAGYLAMSRIEEIG